MRPKTARRPHYCTMPHVRHATSSRPESVRKKRSYRSCDNIKYRLCDKCDFTNNIPRETLASVVDDFNSGDPDLEFPQRQLVITLGKHFSHDSNCQSKMKKTSNLHRPSMVYGVKISAF